MYFAAIEVKLIVVNLLRRFDWSVDPAYRADLDYTSLPLPRDGQPIDLRRLEGAAR
jgi:hypothetical protein